MTKPSPTPPEALRILEADARSRLHSARDALSLARSPFGAPHLAAAAHEARNEAAKQAKAEGILTVAEIAQALHITTQRVYQITTPHHPLPQDLQLPETDV